MFKFSNHTAKILAAAIVCGLILGKLSLSSVFAGPIRRDSRCFSVSNCDQLVEHSNGICKGYDCEGGSDPQLFDTCIIERRRSCETTEGMDILCLGRCANAQNLQCAMSLPPCINPDPAGGLEVR